MISSLSLLLAGCTETQRAISTLPSPAWDAHPEPLPAPPRTVAAAPPSPAERTPVQLPGVLPRSRWARSGPAPALLRPMLPVRYITIHHDGMRPFTGNDTTSAARRLESIRRAHRGQGWADIGYHFAIDRAGNVWQGRSLEFQGAHVKNHNEHNIGVVVLGNFEEQQPTAAQLAALDRHVKALMQAYGVPASRVKTHREWAATACPGKNVHRHVQGTRGRGGYG